MTKAALQTLVAEGVISPTSADPALAEFAAIAASLAPQGPPADPSQ